MIVNVTTVPGVTPANESKIVSPSRIGDRRSGSPRRRHRGARDRRSDEPVRVADDANGHRVEVDRRDERAHGVDERAREARSVHAHVEDERASVGAVG